MPATGQAQPAANPLSIPAASPRTGPDSLPMRNGANPVEKIMALIEAERKPPAAPAAAAPAPAPAAEAPAAEPEAAPTPEAEAPAEAPAETNQQVEGSPAPSDAAAHEIPLDQLESIPLEVTIKGEDGRDVVVKPTIKELREGYMRQQDYSRKTAEVARQREAAQDEVRKGVEGERAAYFQTLQMLQESVVSTMDPELTTANLDALAETDPARYVALDNKRKKMDRVLNEIQSKQQDLIRKREAEKAQVREQQARKSVETLEKNIPGWNDTLYQKLMKTAQETYGYKPDEVGSWVDHRAFEVLHDAAEYRKLKSQAKPDTSVAAKKVVVVPKAVTPGAAAPATAAKNRESEAMKQLQKRGTVQDAAAVIKARMG